MQGSVSVQSYEVNEPPRLLPPEEGSSSASALLVGASFGLIRFEGGSLSKAPNAPCPDQGIHVR